MNLATAQHYAEKIADWLAPFCSRIEIAGSIRRQRQWCNDVDIVCIPKYSSETVAVDMFDSKTKVTNHVREELVRYVNESHGKAYWKGRAKPDGSCEPGPEPKLDAQNLFVILPKCQLDLWLATEETFATRWLCRTGSKEHNIWLAQRAQQMGLHWDPYQGLITEKRTFKIPALSEAELYEKLALPFIEPAQREEQFLAHFAERKVAAPRCS